MRKLFYPVLALLALCAVAAEARVVESFKVRGWRGDAYVNDQSGRFDSCVAIAKYRSQISMSVQVDSNYSWWIGFSAPGWKMTPGKKIPLSYRIDRGAWQQGTAVAISAELARMPMPAGGYIITRFRRGRLLTVTDQVNTFKFRLTGTSRLLARLARCVERNSARYGVDVKPASTAPQQPGTSSASTASREPAAEAGSGNDPKLVIEATQALFNMMGSLDIRGINFRHEDNRTQTLKDVHAVAANDNRTLAAHVYPKGKYESEKVILANIIAEAAKACEGDFSSGTGSQERDGEVLHTGQSSCLAGDVEVTERYAVAPRSRGGVFLYSISDTEVGEGGGSPSAPDVKVSRGQFHRAARDSSP